MSRCWWATVPCPATPRWPWILSGLSPASARYSAAGPAATRAKAASQGRTAMNTAKPRAAKLGLDPAVVREARALASRAGQPIVDLARAHTTVSVERAVLRLAGLDGADADGMPWVNRLVDAVRDTAGLQHGVALPAWDTLLAGGYDDLTALAAAAAQGRGKFRIPVPPAPAPPRASSWVPPCLPGTPCWPAAMTTSPRLPRPRRRAGSSSGSRQRRTLPGRARQPAQRCGAALPPSMPSGSGAGGRAPRPPPPVGR